MVEVGLKQRWPHTYLKTVGGTAASTSRPPFASGGAAWKSADNDSPALYSDQELPRRGINLGMGFKLDFYIFNLHLA